MSSFKFAARHFSKQEFSSNSLSVRNCSFRVGGPVKVQELEKYMMRIVRWKAANVFTQKNRCRYAIANDGKAKTAILWHHLTRLHRRTGCNVRSMPPSLQNSTGFEALLVDADFPYALSSTLPLNNEY
jgi:hypothetical protein